jgi:hypothetical protein
MYDGAWEAVVVVPGGHTVDARIDGMGREKRGK